MTAWRPSGYSSSELMQMQQDAKRRVQEMQQRARRTMEQAGTPPTQRQPNIPDSLPVPDFVQFPQTAPVEQPKEHKGLLSSLHTILDTFGVENDHLVLLLVIFLLLQSDDTDKTLLLALGYLLL